jgi:CHASE2 domain-containing sensor protein
MPRYTVLYLVATPFAFAAYGFLRIGWPVPFVLAAAATVTLVWRSLVLKRREYEPPSE